MKKLLTILVLMALAFNVMASKPVDLTIGTNKEYDNPGGTYSGLTYTVFDSRYYNQQADDSGHNYNRYLAKAYFTTKTISSTGDAFTENDKIIVQFLDQTTDYGYEDKYGYDSNFQIKDYGIYMYEPSTNTVGTFYSALEEGNSFKLDPGKSFGVWFEDKNGDIIGSTGLPIEGQTGWQRGFVGNFDDDPDHDLAVGDNNYNTAKHYICLFEGRTIYDYGIFGSEDSEGYKKLENGYGWGYDRFTIAEQSHFEFMLQTTLDDGYIPVNASGQPLPGTLATLLIGGLCAKTLSKKNKKH